MQRYTITSLIADLKDYNNRLKEVGISNRFTFSNYKNITYVFYNGEKFASGTPKECKAFVNVKFATLLECLATQDKQNQCFTITENNVTKQTYYNGWQYANFAIACTALVAQGYKLTSTDGSQTDFSQTFVKDDKTFILTIKHTATV